MVFSPYLVKTLGGFAIRARSGDVQGMQQKKRVALIALLAAAGGAGVPRDRVLLFLFADSTEERARNALNQLIYRIRQELGADFIIGEAELALNPAIATSDVVELRAAAARGDFPEVVRLHDGPFLDGFSLRDAQEFDQWLEAQRRELHQLYIDALQHVAIGARNAGDTSAAIAAWRRAATADPTHAAVALGLITTLAAAGEVPSALRHAEIYTLLVRDELGIEPDARITAAIANLRAGDRSIALTPVAAAEAQRPGFTSASASSSGTQHAPSGHAAIEGSLHGQSGTHPLSPDLDTHPQKASAGHRPRGPALRLSDMASRSKLVAAVVTAVVTVVLALVYVGVRPSRHQAGAASRAEQSREPVVFPFQVHIADSSLAFLGEGIADLLIATMAQRGGVVPADAHSLAVAWKATSATSADRAAIAVRAMQRVGAHSAILGTVVGSRTLINVSAQIIGQDGRIVGAMVSTSGSPDSVLGIVDRLASALLAGEATQDARRLADLTTRSPQALREYLRALSAMRSGDRDTAVMAFRAALHRDTSFALAALGIASAGGWADASVAERLKHDFRLGWKLRLALAPPERLLFDAAVGLYDPAEDSDAATLERWAQAARAAPDRADVIYEYGDRLFHTGSYLRVPDADALAERAFRQAVRIDSGQIVALGHLAELALSRGDIATARADYNAYVAQDSLSDAAPYLGWRLALATHDSAAVEAFRARFTQLPSGSLRRIAGVSQLEGLPIADAERALEVLVNRERNAREHDLALYRLHAFTMNAGKAAASARTLEGMVAAPAENVTDAPTLGDALDLAITDAVFSVGDSAQAGRAFSRMEGSRFRNPASSLRHACSAELWRLEHGDTARTEAVVRRLAAVRPGIDSAAQFGWQPRICISGLSAALAVARHSATAHDAVERMDALMKTGPRGFGSTFGNLWVARMYVRLGEPSRAATATLRIGRDWDNVIYVADMDALYLRLSGDSARSADYAFRAGRLRALRGRGAFGQEPRSARGYSRG